MNNVSHFSVTPKSHRRPAHTEVDVYCLPELQSSLDYLHLLDLESPKEQESPPVMDPRVPSVAAVLLAFPS